MKRKYVVLIHLTFWLLHTAVTTIPYTIESKSTADTWNIIIQLMISKVFLASIFYTYYFFLGPKFIFRNRILLFVILMVAFNLSYSYLLYYILKPIYTWVFGCYISKEEVSSFYSRWIWYHFIYAVYGTLLRFTIDWFKKENRRRLLEKQKVNAELAFLRSQVNPKFLFYTLGELDEILKINPERTSEGIIKLSEIMRYMLYDAAASEIPLSLEVSHMQNYIDLQELLSGKKGMVKFTIEGNIENRSIPPLLFIHFIENAIKHAKKDDHYPAIFISLTVNEELLLFETQNYFDEKNIFSDHSEGRGMKNIRRRLELLFGNKYSLEAKHEKSIFDVRLIIKKPWSLPNGKDGLS